MILAPPEVILALIKFDVFHLKTTTLLLPVPSDIEIASMFKSLDKTLVSAYKTPSESLKVAASPAPTQTSLALV